MPGYKTHVIGGIITFVSVLCLLQKLHLFYCSYLTALSCFLATILGALFPDVDTKSKGQMMFYQGVLFYLLLLLWSHKFMMFMVVTCLMMIPLLVPHRGLFHNVLFLTSLTSVASIAAFFLLPYRAYDCIAHLLFFYVGALSHVLLDRFQTAIKF